MTVLERDGAFLRGEAVSRRTRKPIVLAAASLVLLGFFQVWHTGIRHEWNHTYFFSSLADGMMHGQLSLPQRPPTKLLALADPYDPALNAGIRLHDAVLFNGRYYLYWGPVPALLAIPFCLAAGQSHPSFGDQYIVFAAAVGILIVAAILMIQIQRRLFPGQPLSLVLLPILSLGIGTPILYTQARPAVYEAAIFVGQFFLLAGFLFLWIGLNRANRRAWPLTWAGICLALSVGSRVSLAPAIGIIVLLAIYHLRRNRGRLPPAGVIGLLLPIMIGAALYCWYNYARFHSMLEFGPRYQLTGDNQNKMTASEFSSPRFIVPNLFDYLLNRPARLVKFPYLTAARAGLTAATFHLRGAYVAEKLVGLAQTQPFLLFAIAAAIGKNNASIGKWLCRSLIAAVMLGFMPALMMHLSTERYLMDMVPCCTILAALGFWQLLAIFGRNFRARLAIEWAAGFIVAAQCVVGLLLSQ